MWEITNPHLKENPFAQCVLDIAMHDLHGKRNAVPLYKLWGLSLKNIPLTNYTIGIDSVEKMVQKMQEFPRPLYKIKLGTKEDVEIVRELRKHTNSVLRVDANGPWTAKQSIENAIALKELQVEFIEQPLPPDDLIGMRKFIKNRFCRLLQMKVASKKAMLKNVQVIFTVSISNSLNVASSLPGKE